VPDPAPPLGGFCPLIIVGIDWPQNVVVPGGNILLLVIAGNIVMVTKLLVVGALQLPDLTTRWNFVVAVTGPGA